MAEIKREFYRPIKPKTGVKLVGEGSLRVGLTDR